MTIHQRLSNWSAWCKTGLGRPKGLPHTSPMFAGALAKDMREGFGDVEAAPDEPRPHVFEHDAILLNEIIGLLNPVDQAALKHHYVTPIFHTDKGRPDQQARIDKMVAEAERALSDLVGEEKTGKPRVIEMLDAGFTVHEIAIVAKVSRQYVWKVSKGKA